MNRFFIICIACLLCSCTKLDTITENDGITQTENSTLSADEFKALQCSLYGETISIDEIFQIAESYMVLLDKGTKAGHRRLAKVDGIINSVKTKSYSLPDTAVYILNFGDDKEFMLLSGDRKTDHSL